MPKRLAVQDADSYGFTSISDGLTAGAPLARRELRWTEGATIDWSRIAGVLELIAQDLVDGAARPATKPGTAVVTIPRLPPADARVIRNWFNAQHAPTIERGSKVLLNGRRRLSLVWATAPDAIVPVRIVAPLGQHADAREPVGVVAGPWVDDAYPATAPASRRSPR